LRLTGVRRARNSEKLSGPDVLRDGESVGGDEVVGLHPIVFGDAEDGLPRLYLMNRIAFSPLAFSSTRRSIGTPVSAAMLVRVWPSTTS